MNKKLLTTMEVAERLGVTRWRINAMIRDRKLSAERYGGIWLIDEKDLAAVMVRKNGRPKKAESDAPKTDKPKQKPVVNPEFLRMFKDDSIAETLAEENSGKPFNHSILELSKSSSDNETLLSTVQVAARLNVSRKSINDYIIQGKLRAVKGKGNHNFIRESDLLEFIAQRGKE
jgi:excisionase family DNA binding protein